MAPKLPVLLLAVLVAGCSAGSGSSPADRAFVAEVHSSAPDIAGLRSDTALVRLGGAVCAGFAGGASFEVVADRLALLQGSRPLPAEDLGAVITAAADHLCPRYRSRVGS